MSTWHDKTCPRNQFPPAGECDCSWANPKPWHPAPAPVPERRAAIQLATDAQLDAIAEDYARTMEARGFTIGSQERIAIRRSAAIQDAWRVAFARGLK